ncbi:aminotransferase, DegT/DnrJ/EryC1/StrS family [Deferribacter desulfuricans SSM1]|uniref:GDP-perosamine synthase n=1 Tax=Deferribacter desulfuricans (strain DSM 14783 / JCM 11476 / NBRC 101012 / SSM1) TaxID=639282 RepID=D3PB89_DEFDS|nr:LegC family aminotransferase [Deferribacter desulfuricans]BAI79862.1 aminotransferase, DegT/DnrJ/EryC1/StrS family [Deferribacter desulfuricans SSM1]
MIKCKKIITFIKELYKKDVVGLHEPVFVGHEKKYVLDTIESTFVSSVGEYVNEFERKIAEYTGAKYAIATVNGISALHIALLLSGVGENSEVITQPITFVATCNAIRYCGAEPVFVDVDLDTLGMSSESLEYFLKKFVEFDKNGNPINKETKRKITACVPMHTFGHPVKIDQIVELCKKYNIPVVEDAAESLGSFYKSKHTGTFGKLGILSFNGNKIITTGGGGMILTNDEDLAKSAKHLTTTAKVPHPYEYFHDEVGYNYRMPNLNAALGLAQMEKLEMFINIKRKIAHEYKNFFENLGIQSFTEPEYSRSNYWLNAIFLKSKTERDKFLEITNKNKVQTRPVWTLMYKLPMYENCFKIDTTNAEYIEERVVNIPSGVNV